MLRRSLDTLEPELIRLCRCRNWVAVCERSQSHPFEASPSELALRGQSTTALSLAIRMEAPREAIHALLKASFRQIEVIRQGNTILVEALRHRASHEVLDYLLQAVLHYQATQQNRVDILGARDELGRTVLHHIVERAKSRFENGEVDPNNWQLFRNALQGRPESVHQLDRDGNTPLVLLLLLPRVQRNECQTSIEEEIFQMVRLMVSASPRVATLSRLLPEPWHDTCLASADGSPTPLYYAILHGRSEKTIDLLINANRNVGFNPCVQRISQYNEVPLHTAISTKASMAVVARVLEECPHSVLRSDLFGLTPVDWIWIRHVVDWYTEIPPTALVSRGRYLSRQFLHWHGEMSRMLLSRDATSDAVPVSRSDSGRAGISLHAVTKDLVNLMRLLLPTAASLLAPKLPCQEWSLLAAACRVHCPMAMVCLALEESSSLALQTVDMQYQRLPLHWAVARLGGYAGNFPVGFTQRNQRLVEPTVVPFLVSLFPAACTVADCNGQLPLAIAIESAQTYRKAASSEQGVLRAHEIDAMEDEVISVLVQTYPGSLEQRDGKSKLLPFQQAALGRGARLNTIYSLLRHLPSLLVSEADDFVDGMNTTTPPVPMEM